MSQTNLSPAFCAANGILIIKRETRVITLGMLNSGDAVLKTRIKKTFAEYECVFEELAADDFNLRCRDYSRRRAAARRRGRSAEWMRAGKRSSTG
jgi:hypothetical protein